MNSAGCLEMVFSAGYRKIVQCAMIRGRTSVIARAHAVLKLNRSQHVREPITSRLQAFGSRRVLRELCVGH
jgi:hypothetical protein